MSLIGPCHAKMCIRAYMRTAIAWACAQSDQDLHYPLKSLNTAEGMDREQRPGLCFAHAHMMI